MQHSLDKSFSKPIAIWLLFGVAMIMIQVLLGGITRLTESGLSITEWKPLTGILPPLNIVEWQAEFDKYKNTDQFRYIHADFTLNDFKFIFFWEWFHRLWARLLGIVFLVGFVYFLIRKKFKKVIINSSLKKFAITIVCILVIQLIYGAFMSGLKAATAAPTWPDINGMMVPDQINNLSPWWKNLVENKITIQLIHRSLAYLLTILVFIWTIKA